MNIIRRWDSKVACYMHLVQYLHFSVPVVTFIGKLTMLVGLLMHCL